MANEPNYIGKNRALWNARTGIHPETDFYGMEQFLAGANSLREIERDLLGDVANKSILHLQCHFGQDSLSLARMGADVTGMDFSPDAIQKARKLNDELNLDARFVCCDLYDLPDHLDASFDIVFTSYGVINWLPDLDRWADVIAHFLEEDGRLVFVEFHPFLWMLDDDFEEIIYPWFNTGPIVESAEGTYADPGADLAGEYVCWNHSLGETANALLEAGLSLRSLEEYNYSPWDIFPESEEIAPNRFIISHFENRVPLIFSMTATPE